MEENNNINSDKGYLKVFNCIYGVLNFIYDTQYLELIVKPLLLDPRLCIVTHLLSINVHSFEYRVGYLTRRYLPICE